MKPEVVLKATFNELIVPTRFVGKMRYTGNEILMNISSYTQIRVLFNEKVY